MSMITEYVRLRPREFAEVQRLVVDEPFDAYEYAGDLRIGNEDEEASSRGMDTDKAWANLQHLLAKAGTPVDIIGGGKPITDSTWGYDSPRLLSVAEVAEASRFLDGTSFASLAEHYDPAALTWLRSIRVSGIRTGRCPILRTTTADWWPCSTPPRPIASRS